MLLLSIVGTKSGDDDALSPSSTYKLGHKLLHNFVCIQIEVTSKKILLLLWVDSPHLSLTWTPQSYTDLSSSLLIGTEFSFTSLLPWGGVVLPHSICSVKGPSEFLISIAGS